MDRPYTGQPEIDRQLAKAIGQLEQMSQVQEQLAQARGEAVAANGLVRVEVGPSGNLTGIVLDPRALRLGPQHLAEAIMEASGAAAAMVAERINELVGPLMGQGQPDFGAMATGHLPGQSAMTDQLADASDKVGVDSTPDPLAEALQQLRAAQRGDAGAVS